MKSRNPSRDDEHAGPSAAPNDADDPHTRTTQLSVQAPSSEGPRVTLTSVPRAPMPAPPAFSFDAPRAARGLAPNVVMMLLLAVFVAGMCVGFTLARM